MFQRIALLILGCVILLCLIAVLAPYSVWEPWRKAEEESEPYYAVVMRVTAKLEFDGIPFDVDELVACKGYHPETAQGRGRMILVPSHSPVIEIPDGGGRLLMRPGLHICGLYDDVYDPKNEASGIIVPEGHIPYLEWHEDRPNMDLTVDPVIPGNGYYESIYYHSATAVKNPLGRLKIIEPFDIQLSPFPASKEVSHQAYLAAKKSKATRYPKWPKMTEAQEYGWRVGGLGGVVIIPEAEWRDPLSWAEVIKGDWLNFEVANNRIQDPGSIARVIDAIDLPEDAIFDLGRWPDAFPFEPKDRYMRNPMVLLLANRKQDDANLFLGGYPQFDLDRLGMLFSEERAKSERGAKHTERIATADHVIPLVCRDGKITIAPELPGQVFKYVPACYTGRPYEFEVPGRRVILNSVLKPDVGAIGVWPGHFFIDTKTMDLWWVDHF